MVKLCVDELYSPLTRSTLYESVGVDMFTGRNIPSYSNIVRCVVSSAYARSPAILINEYNPLAHILLNLATGDILVTAGNYLTKATRI